MKNLMSILAVFMLMSGGAYAASDFEGTFYSEGSIPNNIVDIEFRVFDLKQTAEGCSSKGRCFRMDVIINDVHVARIATSPGKPGDGGIYTPLYNGISLNPSRIKGAGYKNYKGEPMPYAVFTHQYKSSGDSGVAIHAGKVTGDVASHGCLRVQSFFAPLINSWVKKAVANGGSARVWTRDTLGRDFGYRYRTSF